MSWLVVLRPVREEMPFEPTDEESQIVSEHYAYLKQLRAEGRLVLAGPSALPGTRSGSGSSTRTTGPRSRRSSPSIRR